MNLTVHREGPLALLPAAHAVGPEADGDGRQSRRCFSKRLLPGLAEAKVPAVEERADAALGQRSPELLHRVLVGPAVAEEDVERHRRAFPPGLAGLPPVLRIDCTATEAVRRRIVKKAGNGLSGR